MLSDFEDLENEASVWGTISGKLQKSIQRAGEGWGSSQGCCQPSVGKESGGRAGGSHDIPVASCFYVRQERNCTC